MRTKYIVANTIVVLFILLWVYTAISKLTDYQTFRVQLGKSPMLTNMAPVLAWAVPTFEIVIAYLLVIRRTRLLGLYSSIGLMVMFTTYIYITLNFSYYVPCKCGGFISSMEWSTHMVFNLAYTSLAIFSILILAPKQRPKFYQRPASIPSNEAKNLSYG